MKFVDFCVDNYENLVYTLCNRGNNSAKRIRQTSIILIDSMCKKTDNYWLDHFLWYTIFNRIKQMHSDYLKPQTYWKREPALSQYPTDSGKTIRYDIISTNQSYALEWGKQRKAPFIGGVLRCFFNTIIKYRNYYFCLQWCKSFMP